MHSPIASPCKTVQASEPQEAFAGNRGESLALQRGEDAKKLDRWHGPCDSSGTTTTDRGNHTLMKVPKKCNKPASCLCGSVAEPPIEESSRFSAEDCQAFNKSCGVTLSNTVYKSLVPINRSEYRYLSSI